MIFFLHFFPIDFKIKWGVQNHYDAFISGRWWNNFMLWIWCTLLKIQLKLESWLKKGYSSIFNILGELYNMPVCFLHRSILMIMHKVSLEISNSEISHNLKGWSLSTFERIGVFLFQVRARVFCRTGWVRQISGNFVPKQVKVLKF